MIYRFLSVLVIYLSLLIALPLQALEVKSDLTGDIAIEIQQALVDKGLLKSDNKEDLLVIEKVNKGISGADKYQIEVISGSEKKFYFLRFFDKAADNLSHDLEIALTTFAYENYFGPEVYYVDPHHTYMIIGFLQGHPMTMQEANDPQYFEKIAQILQQVHHFPHEKIFYGPIFKKVTNFMNEFIKRDTPMLDFFQKHYEIMKEIEGALDLYIPIAVVHSDFHNDNIIVDPSSKAAPISVIDWESVGLGNPYYDLAYFTVRNDMEAGNRMSFLKTYLGRDPSEQEEAYLYLTEQFYLCYRAMRYFAEIYQQKGVVLSEADHRALRDFMKSDWTLKDILHHEKDKQLAEVPPKSVPIHVKAALVYLKTFEQNVKSPEFQKRMALLKK